MADELMYKGEAATGYDRAFARVATHFVPFLLRAAHITGMRVLDIAAGTGLAAEAALVAVGPTGYVTAADLSPAMVEKARASRRGDRIAVLFAAVHESAIGT